MPKPRMNTNQVTAATPKAVRMRVLMPTVASDSGNSNVGVNASANKPGEAGIRGPNYGSR